MEVRQWKRKGTRSKWPRLSHRSSSAFKIYLKGVAQRYRRGPRSRLRSCPPKWTSAVGTWAQAAPQLFKLPRPHRYTEDLFGIVGSWVRRAPRRASCALALVPARPEPAGTRCAFTGWVPNRGGGMVVCCHSPRRGILENECRWWRVIFFIFGEKLIEVIGSQTKRSLVQACRVLTAHVGENGRWLTWTKNTYLNVSQTQGYVIVYLNFFKTQGYVVVALHAM